MFPFVPVLVQVIAVVLWASFFLLINAPLAAGSRGRREDYAPNGELADPSPIRAGRSRPLGRSGDPVVRGLGRPMAISNYRSR